MTDSTALVPSKMALTLDRARTALAEASDDFERLRIRDSAKAVAAAAEVLQRRDIQTTASTIIQRAERAIVQANPPNVTGRPRLVEKVVTPNNDFSSGVLRQMRQAHSKLSDEQFEERVEEAIETQTPMTRQSLKTPHVSHNSGENEWYTPPFIIEAARQAMGGIDLDPASSAKAQEAVKAGTCFTIDDDGLSKPWDGRIWLNPPYSKDLVSRFVDKLIYEAPEQACILVNNATETAWGQSLLKDADAVCFISSRLKYLSPGGIKNTPLQGQMVCYFGDNAHSFEAEFEAHGTVLK